MTVFNKTKKVMPIDQAYAYAGAAMVENMLERDTDEGITAFLQKRKPDWA